MLGTRVNVNLFYNCLGKGNIIISLPFWEESQCRATGTRVLIQFLESLLELSSD